MQNVLPSEDSHDALPQQGTPDGSHPWPGRMHGVGLVEGVGSGLGLGDGVALGLGVGGGVALGVGRGRHCGPRWVSVHS